MNWESIKESVINFCKTSGIAILKAVGLLIAGFIVIKLCMWLLKKILRKTTINKITQDFAMSVLKAVLYVVLLISVVQQLGVPITGIIAVLSACGLAVGLALQGSLTNLANGMIIITTKPFIEGDYVSIDGQEGTVKSIRILSTTIITLDNKTITLPNSAAVNGAVVNYTGRHTRRVNFDFCVAYESDVELCKKIIIDVINSNGMSLTDPAPFVALKTLGESGINFFAYAWCDSEDYWPLYYYVIENVFNEFKRNNISIPYNQVELRERKDKVVMPVIKRTLPKRVEKIRKQKLNAFEKFESLLIKKPIVKNENKIDKKNKKANINNKKVIDDKNNIKPNDKNNLKNNASLKNEKQPLNKAKTTAKTKK